MVERYNREISKFLRIILQDLKHTSWYEKLPKVETILNEIYHDTTGATPIELQLGKRPTRFWKSWIPTTPDEALITRDQKLIWCRERIQKQGLHRISRHSQKESQVYTEGDLVLLKACNFSDKMLKQSSKFMAIYEGPYIIKRELGSASYLLSDPKTQRIRGEFHHQELRKFHKNTNS